jgi:Ca-activated chloride channel family protein
MFERPEYLWLLAAAPLIAAPAWLAYRAGARLAGALSLVMRLGALAALVMMLAGAQRPVTTGARHMSVVAALDQSASIAPDQAAWMARQIARLRAAMDPRDRLGVIGFARDARLLAPLRDPRLLALARARADPGATDIGGALTMAAGLFAPNAEKRVYLLTDGNQTVGDAQSAAASLAEAGIRIFTAAPPPSANARVALVKFAAPAAVHAGESFALNLELDSEAPHPVAARIALAADGERLGDQTVALHPGINRFKLPYQIDRPGAYLMTASVAVDAPEVTVNPSATAAVSVIAPPRVLMVATTPPESVLRALSLRHYEVSSAPPRGLPADPRAYLAYQAVIIANVATDAISPEAETALNRYVADYGGGLIVTGDTLRDSRFHGTPLEKALPIKFEPQPPPPTREPIAVYLLIDRSNSMSYNSRFPAVRDGERIRYAKEAAIALLNQLDDTDYAGVIAFDSEPYVLGHLKPLGEDRTELIGRVERLEPGGGTDFKEALEIAEREILATGLPVREVILLTDGDTNRQYHDHDQLMADYAKEGIPVSTIRIGPDLENLRLLQDFAHATGGIFYRVEDITKLPQLLVHLTHEAQNFKHHERTTVEMAAASAILNGIAPREVPTMEFFAATEPKEGAEVPLLIRSPNRSTPLLVTWQYQLGRSAVFVADPDSIGSLAWLRWDRYAEFWSQLVDWVARPGDSGLFTVRVRPAANGALTIEADSADASPEPNLYARIAGGGHATDIAMTEVGPARYRGESAPLPRGKYAVTLMLKVGDTEKALLERPIAVAGSEPSDAAEMRIRPVNRRLLREIASESSGVFAPSIARLVRRSGATVTGYRSIAPILLPLAILLMLGDVFVRRRMIGD